MCGEKSFHFLLDDFGVGSPPRVRGEVVLDVGVADQVGITPACAGRSRQASSPACPVWDHPRVCGEKREYFIGMKAAGWITPACAGRSFVKNLPRAGKRDHPRVCGEKHGCIRISRRNPGSPPRVRGEGDRLTHLCTT